MSKYPVPDIDYKDYPKLPEDDFKYLWDADWYDGPLSGVCLYKGREHWFHWIAESDNTSGYRIYVIVELTDKEIEYYHYWHNLFLKHVENKPVHEHSLYYKFAEAGFWEPEITFDKIIGWVDD